MPNVFTAGSLASESLLDLASSGTSTSTSSTGLTAVSCVLLLDLAWPGRVVLMLLVNVFAAFWAAEKTEEKKPVCWALVPGVIDPFSGVGVRGAEVMFDSLLGPIFPLACEPERMRLCDIIFPEGDVTTLGFFATGDDPAKRGELLSVGVGGVLTIAGAAFSVVVGGVLGRPFVSIICGILGSLIRSCEACTSVSAAWGGCGDCRSGNMAPIRAATLPRLLTVELVSLSFSFLTGVEPRDFRSGLGFGLVVARGAKASRSLPTGDADLFGLSSLGACRDAVVTAGEDAEAA